MVAAFLSHTESPWWLKRSVSDLESYGNEKQRGVKDTYQLRTTDVVRAACDCCWSGELEIIIDTIQVQVLSVQSLLNHSNLKILPDLDLNRTNNFSLIFRHLKQKVLYKCCNWNIISNLGFLQCRVQL